MDALLHRLQVNVIKQSIHVSNDREEQTDHGGQCLCSSHTGTLLSALRPRWHYLRSSWNELKAAAAWEEVRRCKCRWNWVWDVMGREPQVDTTEQQKEQQVIWSVCVHNVSGCLCLRGHILLYVEQTMTLTVFISWSESVQTSFIKHRNDQTSFFLRSSHKIRWNTMRCVTSCSCSTCVCDMSHLFYSV